MATGEGMNELPTPEGILMSVTIEQINQLKEWASGSLPLMAAADFMTRSLQREKIWPMLVRNRHDGSPWLDLEGGGTCLDSFGLSSGERAVALLVMELGDHDTGVSLADLLAGLDLADVCAFYESARILTHGG